MPQRCPCATDLMLWGSQKERVPKTAMVMLKAQAGQRSVQLAEGGAGGSRAHPHLQKVWSRTRARFVQINNGL